ncbi:hypothetical protein DL96DRAFT_1714767 [Flagelloscypha sp. PMI_526]|nr:hypothetical protein DL96DRAFT_1714767 [Flagelloscypha sp. PMI_526]
MSLVTEKGSQPLPETMEDTMFHVKIFPSVILPADAVKVGSSPLLLLSESVPCNLPSSSTLAASNK